MTVVAETFIPRSSSNIAQVDYEPDVENLTITFQSGDVYLYFNVPAHEYRGLCAAGSTGQYFHRNIKSRYSYEQQ